MSATLDGVITTWNTAAEQLYGYEADEIVGQPVSVLIPADRPSEMAEIFERIGNGEHVGHYETTRHTKDDLTVAVSLAVSPIYDAGGRVVGASATARDISERQRAEEQLRAEIVYRLSELDIAKSDFVSRVSHELRSPLTSLLGYLEVLEDGEVGPLNDEQRGMLDVMDRNGHRLLSLVEDLLTMARVETGAFRLQTSHVLLSSVVDQVMQRLTPGIDERGLRCTVTVEPGIQLEADPDELERMLANLLSNSIKFTPPGGQIGLAAWTDAGRAVVSVRDTGIGVPVDEQPKLFTRFFRSTISDRFETQGTGLGLFVVKQIVEAHGGDVEAASTPGGGTTITIKLPLWRD